MPIKDFAFEKSGKKEYESLATGQFMATEESN